MGKARTRSNLCCSLCRPPSLAGFHGEGGDRRRVQAFFDIGPPEENRTAEPGIGQLVFCHRPADGARGKAKVFGQLFHSVESGSGRGGIGCGCHGLFSFRPFGLGGATIARRVLASNTTRREKSATCPNTEEKAPVCRGRDACRKFLDNA